jgi:hypothetical protein
MISDISGCKLPFLKLPTWMTVMTSYLFTWLANLVKKPPIWDLSIDQVSLMKQNSELTAGLKYTPVYNGLKDAIESYK